MKKLVLLFVIACGVTGTAYAQRPEWPAKPIKLVHGFVPGGIRKRGPLAVVAA